MHPPVAGVTVLAASTVTVVGAAIVSLIAVGFVVYVIANIRAGRPEAGSEMKLAPNRKPYADDDELGTTDDWRAPALNTGLLRFSEDEVTDNINCGRPFSAMPGWGAAGNKGPLN